LPTYGLSTLMSFLPKEDYQGSCSLFKNCKTCFCSKNEATKPTVAYYSKSTIEEMRGFIFFSPQMFTCRCNVHAKLHVCDNLKLFPRCHSNLTSTMTCVSLSIPHVSYVCD